MIKFRDPNDKILFLSEAGLLNQYEPFDDVEKLSQEAIEEIWQGIIKRRKPLKKRLKDRKRSKIQKQNWKKYKTKYLLALRKWHRSVSGKRFHRALGRFLALRLNRESYNLDVNERFDFLKLLSSLKTHWYIEGVYYKPLLEEVEYELFTEEVLPLIEEIEKKVLIENKLDKDDIEFLFGIFYESKERFVLAVQEIVNRIKQGRSLSKSCISDVIKYVTDNKEKLREAIIGWLEEETFGGYHSVLLSQSLRKVIYDPNEKYFVKKQGDTFIYKQGDSEVVFKLKYLLPVKHLLAYFEGEINNLSDKVYEIVD